MIQENIALDAYNSFRIAANARYFSVFDSLQELETIIQEIPHTNAPPLVLGGGSNILFTRNYDGLVLKNELKGMELVREDDTHYYVKAQAGENWHAFVCHCIAHEYAGLENLSLIPGNVGASPIQNIGAYGVEIKDVFHELEAFHLKDHTIQIFRKEDCAFGYRESVFKKKYRDQFVLLNVTYRLRKQPVFETSYGAIEQELERMGVQQLSIQSIAAAVIQIRRSKLPDPEQIGNAGSFFKNPTIPLAQYHALKEKFPALNGYPNGPEQIKLPAAWLIEQCGWKGYRKRDAGCHHQQALVLVNHGQARGQEILDLSSAIIDSVADRFQVVLEREVNVF